MKTKQQNESLIYFEKHAQEWRKKAEGGLNSAVNMIGQRNDYVLMVADERTITEKFLDVGCGTGELVCEAATRGIDAIGVDYAKEMIELCNDKAQKASLSSATFYNASIFDFKMDNDSYDLVSANGFIEYISFEEMELFFDHVAQALKPGGSFVVGSRNRLFNLFTMNEFTRQEMETPDVGRLMEEAIQWVTDPSLETNTLSSLPEYQSETTIHPKTGIEVSTRYQYTPHQLISILAKKGFTAKEVYPVHIHTTTPSFCSEHPEVYIPSANMLQDFARFETRLLPQASTFMLHAQLD